MFLFVENTRSYTEEMLFWKRIISQFQQQIIFNVSWFPIFPGGTLITKGISPFFSNQKIA